MATAHPTGVAPVRAPVFPRFDRQHDLIARQDRPHWVNPPAQRLSEYDNVWLDAVVVRAEHGAGPGKAGLDLVAYQEDVVNIRQR